MGLLPTTLYWFNQSASNTCRANMINLNPKEIFQKPRAYRGPINVERTGNREVGVALPTFWTISGDPKSFPPAIRKPHGVPLSVRSILALSFINAIFRTLLSQINEENNFFIHKRFQRNYYVHSLPTIADDGYARTAEPCCTARRMASTWQAPALCLSLSLSTVTGSQALATQPTH